MGCGSSAPPTETYTFHYIGDPGFEDKKPSPAATGKPAGSDGKTHPKEEPPKETPKPAKPEMKAAAAMLKRKPSSAKDRFKAAKHATKGSAAFAAAGKARSMRSKSALGWLAKDMLLGPHCSLDKFEPKRVIGTGLMGTVQLAKFKKDNTWCAIKMIKKDYVCRHDDGRHIQTERALLNKCDSPFVVNLFGTFQDKKWIYFVMEFAAGGELFSRLHNKKGIFGVNTTKFYAAEVLLAIEHVQECGYAYRDLKPENVMLDEEGHCKLIDFGFAAKPDTNGLLHTNVGTPAYLSPEQLNHKKTGGYKAFVDWWSFGVLTYEFMTGETPFSKDFKENNYAIYTKVMKGKIKFPGHFDPVCKEMVSSLLKSNVDERMKDPKSIKAHPWFAGVDWGRVERREAAPPHVPRLKEAGDCHYFQQYGEVDDREKHPDKIDHSIFHGF